MRVTCPACGARYALADDAIPPRGRTVQCSACGETWLAKPNAAAQGAAASEAFRPARPDPSPVPARDPQPAPAAMIASLEDDAAPAPRGGFLAGFLAVALLAFASVTVYAKHAAIADAAPALGGALAAYVEAVDAGRAALAETVAGLRGGG